jgi:hypothetical protein
MLSYARMRQIVVRVGRALPSVGKQMQRGASGSTLSIIPIVELSAYFSGRSKD